MLNTLLDDESGKYYGRNNTYYRTYNLFANHIHWDSSTNSDARPHFSQFQREYRNV